MIEPDEFIFTKFAHYFKRRSKKKRERLEYLIHLKDIKSRLTILARALTGQAIDIYDAEREGGFKNNSFFLPSSYSEFPETKDNLKFYVFRVLYLSIQKEKNLNWPSDQEQSLKASQLASAQHAKIVINILKEQFSSMFDFYGQLKKHYTDKVKAEKPPDFSFIYGKFMYSGVEEDPSDELHNFSEKVKQIEEEKAKTILKANAVEEMKIMQVDKKQMEDNVLIHQFEKVETAEEFGGNWKDLDGDDELENHSNALDDLNMRHMVRVDDPTHTIYQAEFAENTIIAQSAEQNANSFHILYPEWDYKKRSYKEKFCKVFPISIQKTDHTYYQETIQDHRVTLDNLRKMLSSINNKYQQQRRQSQGEEFDLDAVTDMYVDIQSGHTPSENIYLSKRKKEKDLSILLLLDNSLSTDGYANNNRVIDVEKQVSILFGEILHEYDIDFSICSFYSKTRNHSTFQTIKGFDEHWSKAKFKVGTLQPSGYTRIGAALRHAGSLINIRNTKNKWIILLSDGKPNDYDRYEGQYGIRDIKQSLKEIHAEGINAYALAIEAQAKYYLPQMFGNDHYQILTTPVELLKALAKVYERIKYKS